MRKSAFCICENKNADQLRGNREADQRLRFRYIDSIIPLLPKSEIFKPLAIFCSWTACLCQTWSETPKTGFLTTRLRSVSVLSSPYVCRSDIFGFGSCLGSLLDTYKYYCNLHVEFLTSSDWNPRKKSQITAGLGPRIWNNSKLKSR